MFRQGAYGLCGRMSRGENTHLYSSCVAVQVQRSGGQLQPIFAVASGVGLLG